MLNVGISTKILPEAISWHFAGSWDHIPEIKNYHTSDRFSRSLDILSRAVAIPVFVYMPEDFFEKLEEVL